MPRTITRLSVPTVMSFRTAQTRSKPEEQRRVADVAHGYIGKMMSDASSWALADCRTWTAIELSTPARAGGYYGLGDGFELVWGFFLSSGCLGCADSFLF